MRNRSPLAHLSALGAWAVAFGCAVGWAVFALPWTAFLPEAGPVGTILGLAAAALDILMPGSTHKPQSRVPMVEYIPGDTFPA